MSDLPTVVTVTGIAGLATGLGALPVFVRARVTHRVYDAALGLAAGLMVAASVFGLILPGIEEGSLAAVMVGVLAGGLALLGGNYVIPHLHAEYRKWLPDGGASSDDAAAMALPVDPVETADAGGSAADDGATEPVSDASLGDPTAPIDDPDSALRKALLIAGRSRSTTPPRGWRSASRSRLG